MIADPRGIVAFWRTAGPARWFRRDPLFDALVRMRLGRLHAVAQAGLLDDWTDDPHDALALVILLDQAPRNLFRDDARAYESDAHARQIANLAIARGFDQRVVPLMRPSFYLPLMHSERIEDQERCVDLYAANGTADGLAWAELHRDIIARFGRFPHRNAVLGRDTTAEEQTFLDEGGFKG